MESGQVVQLTDAQVRMLVHEVMAETFLTMGVTISSPDDVVNMQRDFTHLRGWRESVDAVKKRSILTLVGILVTGLLAAVFLGVKSMLQQ